MHFEVRFINSTYRALGVEHFCVCQPVQNGGLPYTESADGNYSEFVSPDIRIAGCGLGTRRTTLERFDLEQELWVLRPQPHVSQDFDLAVIVDTAALDFFWRILSWCLLLLCFLRDTHL